MNLAGAFDANPIVFIGLVGAFFMSVPLFFVKETLPSKKQVEAAKKE
jgi:hypothetical protein